MSTRRVSVCGASLVCSVDSTKWPVCAALMAISAVSRSRISPTMMTSGSWRRKARSAEAKVSPTLLLTLTWLMPGRLISAGSSAVEMLVSSRVEDIEAGVQRHGLAAAGGAGHQDHALRLGEVLEVQSRAGTARSPARRCRASRCDGSRIRSHDLFAEQRRAGADAKVDGAILGQPHLDAAVLRHAALGDVEARHDLEARDDLDRELHRRLRDFLQHAVHAGADAEGLFVGLEVDVRGAAS